jgi:hypothetical protein
MTPATRRREDPSSRRRAAGIVLIGALVGVTVVAIGDGGPAGGRARFNSTAGGAPGTARANPHRRAPGARVRILSPSRGASVRQPVVIKVEVSGFRLSAAGLDKAPKQGSGHLHFRMDGGRFDRGRYSGANGRLAARLGVAGRFSPAVRPTITYRGLPAGRHTLAVSLANNDLSETGVRARTVFTVR